jgi:hypothetical protein
MVLGSSSSVVVSDVGPGPPPFGRRPQGEQTKDSGPGTAEKPGTDQRDGQTNDQPASVIAHKLDDSPDRVLSSHIDDGIVVVGRRFLLECYMRVRNVLVICWMAVVGVSSRCGGDTPTTPSRVPVGGTWSGTMSDNVAGQGSLTLELRQLPAVRDLPGIGNGTWTAVFGSQTTVGDITVLAPPDAGSASVHRVSADCIAGGGFWVATVTVNDNHMTGTYFAYESTGFSTGVVDVLKQ